MTRYMLTMKDPQAKYPSRHFAGTNNVIAQTILDEHEALNVIRKSMLAIQSMSETSADLMAIDFIGRIAPGEPQAVTNAKNGVTIVMQVAKEGEV